MCLVLTSALASSADAQQAGRFRVTPVKKINFVPSPTSTGTAGINNKGQVVYTYSTVGQSGPFMPFVWLPQTDYGYLVSGAHDLTQCAGSAVARDINMSGFAAGQTGFFGAFLGRAAVWELAGGSSTCTTLATLGGNPDYGNAFAINDENPPVVVGEASRDARCECQVLSNTGVPWPFRAAFVGAGTVVTEYAPAPAYSGGARDVTTPANQLVGYIDCFGSPLGVGCEDGAPQCATTREPASWQNPIGATTLQPLEAPKGSEVLGVNQNLECAGWSFIGNPPCVSRATYWASPTSAPVDISGLPTNQASRAEAINNALTRQVIGSNIAQFTAMLWEETSPGTWTGLDLSSAEAIGCHYQRWFIRQGHDINDLGQIVAYADYTYTGSPNVPPGQYIVLLTPCTTCPGDMTCDGCVNIDDQLAVINSWGFPCLGPCALADADCNYIVNIDDLLAVINHWCPTQCTGGPCCQGCNQCQEGGGFPSGMASSPDNDADGTSNPPTIEELIVLVLQSSQPESVQAEIITQLLEQ